MIGARRVGHHLEAIPGKYEKDCAEHGLINSRDASNRADAIRELAKSEKLEDKILSIMAARDWHGFQTNDRGVLEFGNNGMHENECRDQARCIMKFLETGEFPGIKYPGQNDQSFTCEREAWR
jgi:hypothetical protein